MTVMNAFYAYAEHPASCGDVARGVKQRLERDRYLSCRLWSDMDVSGRSIIARILAEIDQAKILISDVSNANPNVLFETGYAIAKNKRLYPISDFSLTESQALLSSHQFLRDLGRKPGTHSDQIVTPDFSKKLAKDVASTFFSQFKISPARPPLPLRALYFCKPYLGTEEVSEVERAIASLGARYEDNPGEATPASLQRYLTQIMSSRAYLGIVQSVARKGVREDAIRTWFTAGLAVGFGLPTILLIDSGHPLPFDYGNYAKTFYGAQDARRLVEDWIATLPKVTSSGEEHRESVGPARGIGYIKLGEWIAEAEDPRYFPSYFIETKEYRDIQEHGCRVIVGRRGTGKSASYLRLLDVMRDKQDAIVIGIQPLTYDFQLVRETLARFGTHSRAFAAVVTVWKYALYTEIALHIKDAISEKHPSTWTTEEIKFVDFLRDKFPIERDLFKRLESLLNDVKGKVASSDITVSDIAKLTNEEVLPSLRDQLQTIWGNRSVYILANDLDKMWEGGDGADALGVLLAAFVEAGYAVQRELESLHGGKHKQKVRANWHLFVKDTSYDELKRKFEQTDKLRAVNLDWRPVDLLMQVPERRFLAHFSGVTRAEFWDKYFLAKYFGTPLRKYLDQVLLPRPRDIIVLCSYALDEASKLGHDRVLESDMEHAEMRYSEWLLESVRLENGVGKQVAVRLQNALFAKNQHLSKTDMNDVLGAAEIADMEKSKALRYLVRVGMIEVHVRGGHYQRATDGDAIDRLLAGVDSGALDGDAHPPYFIARPFHFALGLKIPQQKSGY